MRTCGTMAIFISVWCKVVLKIERSVKPIEPTSQVFNWSMSCMCSNYNMIFLRLCLPARLNENYILFWYAFSILFPRASGRSSSAKSNFVSSSGTAASHFDQTSSQHIPENLERSMERTWFFNPFHSTKTQVTQVTQVPPRPRNWS